MSHRIVFGGSDTTPDSFTLSDVTSAEASTVYTATVTPTGFDSSTTWSVDAGDARTTSNATYATSGVLLPGETLTVRRTSSSSYLTAVNTIVTIGGVTDTWTITTRTADTAPNAFTFTDKVTAEPSTSYSTSLVPTGYDYASWSVTGGEGSINGSTWATSGSITSGQTFYIRGTSSSSFSAAINVTATIGGVSDIFSITTRAADTTPNGFSFTDVTSASLSTVYTSNTITITGLEPNYSVTVSASGGTVDAGTSALSGTYAASKTVTASATGTIVVAAQVTSSGSFSTAVNCTVTIGGVSDVYSVTTRAADTTPNAFSFTDVTSASLSTVYTSNTVTVSGLEPNYSITVSASGGTRVVDAGTSALSGTFASSKTVTTSASGTLVVAARLTTSALASTATDCTVTIGGVSDTYTVTTQASGEAAYTTAGSYTWTCPAGVTSVCVVCVGGGGAGGGYRAQGAGGGLGYANNIAVTPGQAYTVVVGSAGTYPNGAGQNSYFIAPTTVSGNGGRGGPTTNLQPSYGGGWTGGGGGSGGNGPIGAASYSGAGGAGGYSGAGGQGGGATISTSTLTTGSAGSGGGGGGGSGARVIGGGGYAGGSGGGVGLFGQGSNGAGGVTATVGSTSVAGQPGGPGSGGSGKSYGGGGGSSVGGIGAVRIIWGAGRSFPSSAT